MIKFFDKVPVANRKRGGQATLLVGRAMKIIRALPDDQKAAAYLKLDGALDTADLDAMEDVGTASVLDANDTPATTRTGGGTGPATPPPLDATGAAATTP